MWLLHNDVLALDPTESTQALLPRFDELWGRSSHADSSNGWRRLRLGAKRRGEEAAAQGAKEGVLSRCRLQNHVAAARELGRVLAQRQLGVVYGGARVGLMGALADAALSGGGHVIGVMPEALVAKEVAHRGLSEVRVVKSIHEHKAIQGRPLPMYPCPAARVRARPGGDPRPRSGWLAQLVVGWLVTCSCGWEREASFGTTRSPDLPAAGVTDMRSALLRQWSLANGAREDVQGCVAL